MNKFIILSSLLLFFTTVDSTAQGIKVYKGGDFEYYSATDVDSIVFVMNGEEETMRESYINGHRFVDLGLPSGTLWATCNIGTDTPEGKGKYYAWGELMEKMYYTLSNYSLVSAGNTRDLSDTEDIAYIAWGGGWRMPTRKQFVELLEECSWSWEKYRGTQGSRVTGPNGKSIFLPASSYKDEYYNATPDTATYGSYWSRTHAETMHGIACGTELVFGTTHYNTHNTVDFYNILGPTGYCFCGRMVRPVHSVIMSDGNNFTSFIDNPSFEDNIQDGWNGSDFSNVNYKAAEFWNTNFDTYQKVTDLPAGKYVLRVKGFYRKGQCSEDYLSWTNGDTSNDHSLIYAISSVSEYSQPFVSMSSAALDNDLSTKGKTLVVGDGLYVPNDMASAVDWFSAGYYENELPIEIGDDGILIFGVKKEKLLFADWTIMDDWRLIKINSEP